MAEVQNKYAGDMHLVTSANLKDTDNIILFDESEGKRISVGDAVLYFAENMLSDDVETAWTGILGE